MFGAPGRMLGRYHLIAEITIFRSDDKERATTVGLSPAGVVVGGKF
jgi:hypothetical protein